MSYFVLSSHFIFLNTETNTVINLNPFNSDNKSISLLLILDSVSLSCSSRLNEFKVSLLCELAKPLKACFRFTSSTFFFNFTFFVSLYKELLEPTFSVCLIVLDNLYEVLGSSVITDFISTMFRFSKAFCC